MTTPPEPTQLAGGLVHALSTAALLALADTTAELYEVHSPTTAALLRELSERHLQALDLLRGGLESDRPFIMAAPDESRS